MNDGLNFYFTWEGQQTGVLVYLIVIFANTLVNVLMLRRLDSYCAPPRWPSVAVLIPARNEESTIGCCIESLLVQDYPDYAIWALDDQSTDNTAAILSELSARHSRLTILSGHPLPDGWLGKPWACQQLAEASDSELLLYVDSDTWHHPDMLRDAVSVLEPRVPVTTSRDTTLEEAVATMRQASIGCLVVTGKNERLVGLLAERDLLRNAALEAPELSAHTVGDVMTQRPESVREDRPLAYALQRMIVSDLRYLPLIDATGQPVGIASSRDIINYIATKFRVAEH